MTTDKPYITLNATVVHGVKLTSIINLDKAKILVLTCIDEFQLFYLLPDDRIEHWKFIADTVIMDADVKSVNLEIK